MSQDLTILNKQAIAVARRHMGRVAWPTMALVLFVVAAFVMNLMLFAHGLLPVWVATLLLGALTYMSYTPLHEAAHGNIHGSNDQRKWLNDLCGYVVAPLIAVPYASHRHEHFTHHRYTNQPDKDPDYIISGMSKGNNLTRASYIELEAAELLIDTVPSVDMVKFCKNGSNATSG